MSIPGGGDAARTGDYHMRAVFQASGSNTPVFTDVDHTFTTGTYATANLPTLTATTTARPNSPVRCGAAGFVEHKRWYKTEC